MRYPYRLMLLMFALFALCLLAALIAGLAWLWLGGLWWRACVTALVLAGAVWCVGQTVYVVTKE